MPKERELQVSPGHKSHELGGCNACLYLCDERGHTRNEDVWLIQLAGMKFRLCEKCMEEFLLQVRWHKTGKYK